jgi:hypothetical protein
LGLNRASGEFVAIIEGFWRQDPADIPRLYKLVATKEIGCAVGWRKNRSSPLPLRVGSFCYTALANLLYGLQLPDVNGSPLVFRRGLLEKPAQLCKGPFFQIDLLCKIKAAGGKILALPVKHYPPRNDSSERDAFLKGPSMFIELVYHRF